MSFQASNGCGHFRHLGVSNRHSIDRGCGLNLVPVRGFLLLFPVQVDPAFLQRIHFLILGIGVPALVNVVQLMGRKFMIATDNTSLNPIAIKHADTAATAATAIMATPPEITTSVLVATGRICRRNITVAEFTAFC